ncbi:MAG: hypothetical protein JXA74_01835 [Anaerolineae bacterium]|nr:hypothetical protein [Anaerolineae bacterium]
MCRRCNLAMLLVALALFGAGLISGGHAVAQSEAPVAIVDDDPPIIQTFSIEPVPRKYDTGGQSQLITVTLSVYDMSGIDGGACGLNVKFVSPSGRPLQFIYCHGVEGEPDALIDDELFPPLALWQNVQPLPAHSEPGEWRIEEVWMVDAAGNQALRTYADMLNDGFPVSFQVANTYELSIPVVFNRYRTGTP